MKSRLLPVCLLALTALNASCADSDDSERNYDDDEMPSAYSGNAQAADVPVISNRNYTGGSAKVRVTGAFEIDADIPINTQASLSSDDMTWLQYGVSGSEAPNALVTVSTYEVGIGVANGKPTATAGVDNCTGSMQVTASSVTGHYKCRNVTSYDPSSGKMGSVNIEIDLTAT